jgi:uncharacterized SAM-binding protein YcdF (DUF218 family)
MELLLSLFKDLIDGLVSPLVICLACIALGLSQPRKRWARYLAGLSLTGLVLLSMPACSYFLASFFEQASAPLDPAQVRAAAGERAMIVILGGGANLGAIEYPGGESLSSESLERSRYGVRLAQRSGLPLAVSGGKTHGSRHRSEADLLQEFIQGELKQPVALAEDQSLNTRENALFVARRLATLKIDTVVLVTDVTHMPRAAEAFEVLGVKVVRAPIGFRSTNPARLRSYLPSLDGLKRTADVFHEVVGTIWYRLRRVLIDGP